MKKIRIITVIILCLGSVLAGCAAADSSRKPDTEPLGLNERAEEQKGSEEISDPDIVIEEEPAGKETEAEVKEEAGEEPRYIQEGQVI